MNALIPAWVIGAPFVALVILSFSFRAPSEMGGSFPRQPPERRDSSVDHSAPLLGPMRPDAPRRII